MAPDGLALVARCLLHTYDGQMAPGHLEWPPSPARLLAALVAACVRAGLDLDPVRWLERQQPPEVLASEAHSTQVTRYAQPITLSFRRRSNLRQASKQPPKLDTLVFEKRLESTPAVPWFAYLWPTAPEPDVLNKLCRVAAEVPYLGSPESPILLSISTRSAALREAASTPAPMHRYAPVPPSAFNGAVWFPAGYPGLVDALLAVERETSARRPHSVYRRAAYERHPLEGSAAVVQSVRHAAQLQFLAAISFPPGGGLPAQTAHHVARALRRAVLSQLGADTSDDPVTVAALAIASGHYPDGQHRPHCAYLPIPDLGHRYASGQLLGAIIAVPTFPLLTTQCSALCPGLDPAEALVPIIEALERICVLRLTPGIELPVSPGSRGRRLLEAATWSGPAVVWQSATPIVPANLPRRARDMGVALRTDLAHAALPDPVAIDETPAPVLEGAPRGGPLQLHRRHHRGTYGPRLPSVHATITFGQPVEGIVTLGQMRFLGMGLMMPGPSTVAE